MAKLSQYFVGVAAKRLSTVEVNKAVSNQHEFNGVSQLKEIFGTEKLTIDSCQFIYIGEDEDSFLKSESALTWYDSRENHPTRSEYRLYFQSNDAVSLASEGDLLIVARQSGGSALVLVVKQGSTFERQVIWLFGLNDNISGFEVAPLDSEADKEIGFIERTILETLSIETEENEASALDDIFSAFGEKFPTTKIFSEFARSRANINDSATSEPDNALLKWMNTEEILFRTLERHIVQEQIAKGFETVDEFIQFSLSVHNRRKSRVGFALEHHLETIFTLNKVSYSRGNVTENNSKPDFIFPGISSYRNEQFPVESLTMLGVKSTCKDRWRQVLSEAKRINDKHLFTLEAGISRNQTEEMKQNHLQLVLPKALHSTYMAEQQNWLMSLSEFIDLTKKRQ